jgi:hypothetical protein
MKDNLLSYLNLRIDTYAYKLKKAFAFDRLILEVQIAELEKLRAIIEAGRFD